MMMAPVSLLAGVLCGAQVAGCEAAQTTLRQGPDADAEPTQDTDARTMTGSASVELTRNTSLLWKYVPFSGNLPPIAVRHGTNSSIATAAGVTSSTSGGSSAARSPYRARVACRLGGATCAGLGASRHGMGAPNLARPCIATGR